MDFPYVINDESHLNRLVRQITSEVVPEVVYSIMVAEGKISKEMTQTECYKQAGRRRVDEAERRGELKFKYVGKYKKISRSNFSKWNNKLN